MKNKYFQADTQNKSPENTNSGFLLPIGGITPFSTIDCPGKLSSVFFLQGCHLKCGYCHNKHFQKLKTNSYPLEKYKNFLEERKGFIDTVVFSGGEPFLHFNELLLMAEIAQNLGFEIALHTTGSFPDKLDTFVKKINVSWVGIDLKAPKQHYKEITGSKINYFSNTVKSISVLTSNHITFETRTTINNQLNNNEKLSSLIKTYEDLGIEKAVLQPIATEGKQNLSIKSFLITFAKNNNLKNIIVR